MPMLRARRRLSVVSDRFSGSMMLFLVRNESAHGVARPEIVLMIVLTDLFFSIQSNYVLLIQEPTRQSSPL